jgi:hypothetical protein
MEVPSSEQGGHALASSGNGPLALNLTTSISVSRVPHGYGFSRGASKTGTAGTGTVLDFGTLRHTAYPYRGVTGIHGFYGMAEVSKGEP